MTDHAEKAQAGLRLIEEAIFDALAQHKGGLYNNELSRLLGIESDYEGRQHNYLSYSILGGLLAKRRIRKEKRDGKVYYLIAESI